MLLGLIFSILTATYTLSSTTTVEVSGTTPESASHLYARSADSGQKGQMTAGNATCLTLTGWEGCTIHSLALQMRSNTSSGKGSLSVQIGDNKLWEIHNQSFADSIWNGAYSTDWVSIQRDLFHAIQEGEDIEIIISATENSLYIHSYTLTYSPAAPKPYTVEFITGLDSVPPAMTQSAIGAPIVLPEWTDTVDWYFLGWSTQEIERADHCPDLLPAGTSFLPTSNTRLWAIYTDNTHLSATTDYVSGDYIITQIHPLTEQISGKDMGWALYSTVQNGEIPLQSLSLPYGEDSIRHLHSDIATDMIYTISFLSDSTLTIQHTTSQLPIGYQARTLSATPAEWHYRLLDDGSLAIYYLHNGTSYALWLGFGSQATHTNAVAYSQKIALSTWVKDGFWLYPAIIAEYTAWPLGKWNALEKTEVTLPLSLEYTMYFGPYQLVIKDGKKYLQPTP